MGLLGAALQKEGPRSGAVGVKGLRAPGGTSPAHSASRAEAAEKVFGQGRTPGPAKSYTGEAGTYSTVPPAWAQRLHL